jgi:hypothetical protein
LRDFTLEVLGKFENQSRRPSGPMGKRQPVGAKIDLEFLEIDETTLKKCLKQRESLVFF